MALALALAPLSAGLAQTAPPSRPSGGDRSGSDGSGVEIDEGALAAGLLSWAVKKKREADAKKKAEEAARKEAEARAAADAAAAPPPVAEPVPTAPPTQDSTAGLPAGPQPYQPTARAAPRPTPAPSPVTPTPAPAPAVAAAPSPAPPPPVAAAPAPVPPPVPAMPPSAEAERPRQAAWPWLLALLAVAAGAAAWSARRFLGWGAPPPYARAGVDAGDQDAPDFGDLTLPAVALHVSPGGFESDMTYLEAAE